MKMLLKYLENIKIKNAADLARKLSEGYAIRRNDQIDSVFFFIGIDGNLYSTDAIGGGRFKLAEHYCTLLYEGYEKMEVYGVSHLAYDNIPWGENEIMIFSDQSKAFFSRYYFHPNTKLFEDKPIEKHKVDYRFMKLLYPEGSNNIWIHGYPRDSVDRTLQVNVLLKDNKTIYNDTVEAFDTEYEDIRDQIIAYQPIN